jgi:hypothetical protein
MRLSHYGGRVVRASAIVAALSTFCVDGAVAADVRVEPRVELGGLYNDNFRLSSVTENEVQGALLDARVALRSVTPTSNFYVMPRVRSTYFPDDRDEDSNDPYLTAGFDHAAQTWRFGLDAGYSRENLLTSEQPEADAPDAGLGGGTGVDNGALDVRNRRDLIRVAPAAKFDLTQTRALELTGEYLSADYDRATGDATDFDSLSGSAGVSFQLSPTNRFLVAATGTSFDPDTPLTGRSTSYGLKGEWWNNRSEILQSYLRAGAERTEEDDPEIGVAPDASTNYILGAGMTATYQVTQFFADFSRGVRPNASGELVARNDLRLRVRRSFTPTLAGFVAALGSDDTSASDDSDFRDRRYYSGSAGIEWRFTREFALIAAYDYRRQKREDEDTATSNQVSLSFVYEPPRRDGPSPLGILPTR